MTPPQDPLELFRTLKEIRPSEEFWTGFWPSVRAGIRELEMRRRPTLSPFGALLLGSSAGIMVAAAVLAVGFLIVPALTDRPLLNSPREALRPSAHGTAEQAVPHAVLPVMENPGPPTARVYTFHVGGKADETDVILIVDESLDI